MDAKSIQHPTCWGNLQQIEDTLSVPKMNGERDTSWEKTVSFNEQPTLKDKYPLQALRQVKWEYCAYYTQDIIFLSASNKSFKNNLQVSCNSVDWKKEALKK